MAATIQRKLNDSPVARWTALVLIALMMFFGYMFVDVMSPLKSLIESARGWDSATFGTYASSEYFLNVFFFFLIFAGIILDKMGIRFTGLLSASLMVIGATIKFVGISDWFQTTEFCAWLNSWWVAFPGSAKMASLGFMIFGCGCEMAGTTVSKAIAKWFEGKEMALAMGLEMAIARLGVFAVMWLAPMISNHYDKSIVAPVAFCTALLVIGLLCYTVFVYMDRKLDRQLIAAGEMKEQKSSDEEFHVRDLGLIFRSKMFWLVALLCVLYYSAIFPFQRYAPNFLEVTLQIDAEAASRLFSCFPILAMLLTPLLGAMLDFRGKGNHDRLPPEFRLPAAGLPVEMARPAARRDARRVVLARPRGPVALGAEDHRREDPRIGLLPDLLDPERRALPRAAAHRTGARRHGRIYGPDDYLLDVRHPGLHLQLLPQDRGSQKGIRSRASEHQEIAPGLHPETTRACRILLRQALVFEAAPASDAARAVTSPADGRVP